MEEGKPSKRVVLYVITMTVVSMAAFVALIALVPVVPAEGLGGTLEVPTLRQVAVLTMVFMFVAGVLGGCLYSLRGLTKHTSANDYSANYDLSYYLRPISSGICGLMVFFLLLGGALTLNIGGTGTGGMTFAGRMPYIALSLLAGYGSQEFMLKMKDVADSIFAIHSEDKTK
jgi:hypothetical protein